MLCFYSSIFLGKYRTEAYLREGPGGPPALFWVKNKKSQNEGKPALDPPLQDFREGGSTYGRAMAFPCIEVRGHPTPGKGFKLRFSEMGFPASSRQIVLFSLISFSI